MKIVFVTNYYTPHQVALSLAFFKRAEEFFFVETEPRTKDIPIGWRFNGELPSFVIPCHNLNIAQKHINDADIVIIGSAPDQLLNYRHRRNMLNFRYSERIFKRGVKRWQLPLRFIKYYFRCNRHPNDFLLCASAYAAEDYALTRSFLNKTFKWGYFPIVTNQEYSVLLSKKKNTSIQLLWVGRFIDWKHPEKAILLAKYLKS